MAAFCELLALGTEAYNWAGDQELKITFQVGVGLSNGEIALDLGSIVLFNLFMPLFAYL